MRNLNFKKVLCAVISITMLLSFALVNSNAKTIVRGDVNGDGTVQTSDARLALRAAVSLERLDDDALLAADVDEHNGVQTSDARTILRVAVGLEKFENPEIVIEDATDAEEPSTDEPTTEEPSTDEPTTEEPSTDEPTTEEPSTDEPTTEEPSTDEPTTEEPSTEEPSTDEPTTEEPSTDEPTTEEPSTDEPTTEEPSTDEPTTDNDAVSYPKAIDGLFEQHFYMELEGGGATGGIARNGNDSELTVSMDGLELSIYISNDSVYLKYDVDSIFGVTKYYYKMSQSDLAGMGIDFDSQEMLVGFNFGTRDDYKEVITYTETLDNVEYTVYEFITEQGSSACFFADADDNIKAVCSKDENGNNMNDLAYFDVLTYDIPDGMCSVSGRVNDITMVGMMTYMQQNGFLDNI